MYLERFGDLYASATTLPYRRPDEDVGTDSAPPSNVVVPGGVFDASGGTDVNPQGRTIAVRGILTATTAALLLTAIDALRAWRGKRSKLWMLCNDASVRWRYAKLLTVEQPASVNHRHANAQEVNCIFELDGSGVWKASSSADATIDLASTSNTATVTNDGNVPVRDAVLRLKNWLQNANTGPTKVVFYDQSGGTYTDLTNTYDSDTGTFDTITAMQTLDRLYVGYSSYPFCQVIIDLSTYNNNAAVMAVELYNGAWVSPTTFIDDETSMGGASFARDGRIRWILQDMTKVAVDVHGTLYWVRIYFDAALDNVNLNEVDVTRFPLSATAFSVANRTEGHQSKISYAGTITSIEEVEIDCESWAVRMWTTPDEVKHYPDSTTYADMPKTRDDDTTTVHTFSEDLNAGNHIYVGDSAMFDAIRVNVTGVNATTSVLHGEYWNGSAWVDVPGFEDGTASGGIALAQDGTITFGAEAMADDWTAYSVDSDTKYWVRLETLTGTIESTECTIAEIDIRLTADLWANLTINTPPHSISGFLRLGSGANYLAVTRTAGSVDTDLVVEFYDSYA